MMRDPRPSHSKKASPEYRTAGTHHCTRSRGTQPRGVPPGFRSCVLSKVLRALWGGWAVWPPRRTPSGLAAGRRLHGAVRDRVAGPLAVPRVPTRLYRLSRLSYSPISVTPDRPCCIFPPAIWSTTGRVIAKRPVQEADRGSTKARRTRQPEMRGGFSTTPPFGECWLGWDASWRPWPRGVG